MDITLKLSTDFERCLDNLKNKYGVDFEYINGIHPSQVDYSEFLDKFVKQDTLADVTIDPNANTNRRDIRSFITEKGKSADKLFGLNKIFCEIKKQWGIRTARQWLEQEFSRGFYLNDATSASYFPYCYAVDLSRLATEGLFFLSSYNNQPPKHLTTYFDDVIEFISFLSNRQSGAVGLPNVLIWSWYFWNKDCQDNYYLKDPDTYLRQNFQKFIYRLNQPFLRINQCAFTNVSIFDRPYLESLFGGIVFPDGTLAIEHIEDFINVQKVFMEVVSDIRETSMFTFPVLTYSLLRKKDISQEAIDKMVKTKEWDLFVDDDFARWCSNHNIKWSDSNFFVSDNVGTLSNCCRLLSDTKKLDVFVNSIGGTALSVGSCRVSTINLVRIAYESNCKEKKYLDILKERVLLDCKALASMRHILKRNIEKGLLPNYQDGALELSKQFSTIGGIGLYEVMDMFGYIGTDEFGNKFYTDDGIRFATQILDTINEVKDNFEQYYEFELNGKNYKLSAFSVIEVTDDDTGENSTMTVKDAFESERNLSIKKVVNSR